MKNVGLLTLNSHIYNYGGILQEYALQQAIISLGCDCEIIDYDVTTELNTFSIKRSLLNFSIDKVLNKIKRKKVACCNDEVNEKVILRKKQFDLFRDKYMKLSKSYSYPDLKNSILPYDAIVCGSDQIWNPDYNIPSFFLEFADKNVVKMVYAASIGKTSLTPRQLRIYNSYINGLDYVSVREESARKMFNGISNSNIELVLDPTLLLEGSFWKKHINNRFESLKPYIFCYFLDYTDEKVEAVRKYADRMGLQIVIIPYLHDVSCKAENEFGDIKIYDAGPEEFLGLINAARIVLTDSFHATVFSILFEKDFRVFGRISGNYNMNTRIENLLQYFDIEERLINPHELGIEESSCISVSMEKIKDIHQKSVSFLKKITG